MNNDHQKHKDQETLDAIRAKTFTTSEAAELLSMSPQNLIYWVEKNEIPYCKWGKQRLIYKEALKPLQAERA